MAIARRNVLAVSKSDTATILTHAFQSLLSKGLSGWEKGKLQKKGKCTSLALYLKSVTFAASHFLFCLVDES